MPAFCFSCLPSVSAFASNLFRWFLCSLYGCPLGGCFFPLSLASCFSRLLEGSGNRPPHHLCPVPSSEWFPPFLPPYFRLVYLSMTVPELLVDSVRTRLRCLTHNFYDPQRSHFAINADLPGLKRVTIIVPFQTAAHREVPRVNCTAANPILQIWVLFYSL